jgi:multidrug efflux pump subunit AcrA (membrane-fusion protein)
VIVIMVVHNNGVKAAAAKRALAAVKPSVTATTATATKGDIGIYLDAIGTVTPVYTTYITAQANGVLTAVHYSEGQFVQKGSALIDIDPRPYQAQLAAGRRRAGTRHQHSGSGSDGSGSIPNRVVAKQHQQATAG